MGLDGGTIISRSDVLRGSSWRVASQTSQHRSTRGGQLSSDFVAASSSANTDDPAACWNVCSLTGLPLREPVMACHLGRLYNKESVLEFLLAKNEIFLDNNAKWRHMNREQWEADYGHIRSLKDVFELQFCRAPESSTKQESRDKVKGSRDKVKGQGVLHWICPLTGSSFASRLSAIKTCGHFFNTQTLQQVRDGKCPLCNVGYSDDDVVYLHGSEDEKQILLDRIQKRRNTRQKKGISKRPRLEPAPSTT